MTEQTIYWKCGSKAHVWRRRSGRRLEVFSRGYEKWVDSAHLYAPETTVSTYGEVSRADEAYVFKFIMGIPE